MSDASTVAFDAAKRWALMYPIPAWGLAQDAVADKLADNWALVVTEMILDAFTAADIRVGEGAGEPRRGDKVEAWLKRQRDELPAHAGAWHALDLVLDLYQLHADCGVPLDQDVPGPHEETTR